MKARLLISIITHIIMNDLEDRAMNGVIIRIALKLREVLKYLLIYKKRFYQWGMSPLALLAYLISNRGKL